MKARRYFWLIPGLLAGLAVTAMAGETAYTGRRADHLPMMQTQERAEFAAMEQAPATRFAEPAYSGRRADHIAHILTGRQERAEFAAMEGTVGQPAITPRTEPAYSGRRADHLY